MDNDSSYIAFHHDGTEEDDNFEFEENEHSEELNVNWCVFFSRVFAVVLLICLTVALCLGGLDTRLFYLGAMLFGVFLICLIGSFFTCCQRLVSFQSNYINGSAEAAEAATKNKIINRAELQDRFII